MSPHDEDWTGRVLGAALGTEPSWQRSAYDDYRSLLASPGYPCFFGRKAEQAKEVFYAFVARQRLDDLLSAMRSFVGRLAEPASARHSLVAFFEADPAVATHADFTARFWAALQYLSDHDPGVPPRQSPDDPAWEFSFGDVQMFVVGTSETYAGRKSRHIGQGMALIFQPRLLFLDPATGKPIDLQIRHSIHRRMLAYDGMPVHPDIGVFGRPENREWKQYVLPDDNAPITGRCPFHAPNAAADAEEAGRESPQTARRPAR